MLDPVTQIDFPFFQRDVAEMFGEPDEGDWAQQYLKNIDLTMYAADLAHVRDYEGNPWGHKIYGNYVMEGPLQQAFGLMVSRGLAHELHTYDGCFNIRRAKGGNIMSMHSWGLAVDLNAATNPFSPSGRLITDFSDEFTKCFAEAGFEAGRIWNSPKDPMHFQIAWIRDWSNSDNPLRPIPYARIQEVSQEGIISQDGSIS